MMDLELLLARTVCKDNRDRYKKNIEITILFGLQFEALSHVYLEELL